MKIDSSSVALDSRHASVEQHSVRESLRIWRGNQRPDFEGQARADNRPQPAAIVTISEAARGVQSDEARAIQDSADEAENDPRMQLILRMVEALTGQKIRLVKHEDLQPAENARQHLDRTQQASQAMQQQRSGWGMEYERHEVRYEAEQTSFAAQGVVRTADGREIRFTLQLAMSREYYEESSLSLRAGDDVRKDPLVINFNGMAAQLTDVKFEFDIDADGQQDNISFVAPGSGFLALDRNGDGKINDGAELFGTKSGNGFADLAQYDSDGNHWIDENDPIYADLRVWTKDADGKDQLRTLAALKVGALYLGNVSTPFSINNSSNAELGQLQNTGIYLSENGNAGTLQQIDLVV